MATIPLIFAQEDVEFGGKPGITEDFAYNNNVQQASLNIRMAKCRANQQHSQRFALTGVFLSTTDLPTSTHLVTYAALRTPHGEHIRHGQRERGLYHQPCKTRFALSTFVQAYAIGVVLTFYDQVIVLQALVLTLSVVAGLSAFTFQTKRDFSFLGYGLFGGLMLLMVAAIMQLFLGSSVFELVISLAGAFLFAIFIVYDTQPPTLAGRSSLNFH
uniref:Uncharacterized protein n=1 Tax=Timema monikensis TaxID=170555 RepID=A0A7R9HVM8_9NEOP|nr:unnamed protein product [Timema monikensis]